MEHPPYRIYLQFMDDDGNQLEEITWSDDKVYQHDIEYVLAKGDYYGELKWRRNVVLPQEH